MFCPQCGTAHTPGGRFCGNCGLLLPFTAMAGASLHAGATRSDAPGVATRGAHRRALSVSLPTFTLAVVACVVAFGLVFVAASAVVRDLPGDPMERSASAHSAGAPQGAMGTLLTGRRTDPADATDPTDPAHTNRRR